MEKEIPDNEKTVILFDEISWMARGHRGLVSSIKAWWDLSIVREKNVLLILCGSVSTWIEKNIIKSTVLYGRISAFINLKPLSITDASTLLRLKNFNRLTIQTDVISEVKQKIKRLVVPRYKGIAPVLFHMGEVSEKVFDSSFFSRLIELESFLDEDLYTIKY